MGTRYTDLEKGQRTPLLPAPTLPSSGENRRTHDPSAGLAIMATTPTMQSTLQRYHQEILGELRSTLQQACAMTTGPGASDTPNFYGQMQYHLGWVDASFAPASSPPGKLLCPTLLLLAFGAAGANGVQAASIADKGYLARASGRRRTRAGA